MKFVRKNVLPVVAALAMVAVSPQGVVAEQILCPGKMSFVTIGDDVNTVINTCGKPKRVIQKTSHPNARPKSMHWYYYGTGNNFVVHNSVISFYEGKVSNIVASGASAASTDCVNGQVKKGDSMATVRSKCGFPVATADDKQLSNSEGSYQAVGETQQREDRYNPLNLLPQSGKWKSPAERKKQEREQEARRPHKFTVLIYQPQPYMQKKAFMFIDDRLTQTGQVTANPGQSQ
ncbi:MAG: DUF2845 domain-containing protein [Coxiellaceae bacterium]|nr:DUF2845 domain-containing protein [Coxiellaceae bacterium]